MSPSPSDGFGDGGVVTLEEWRVLRVAGSDRIRFLHSQITSDLRGLAGGSAQLSALLSSSGRVRGFFLVARADQEVVLLAPGGCFDAVRAGLEEHVIADDVSVAELRQVRPRLALGPAAQVAARASTGGAAAAITALGARGLVLWDESDDELPELPALEVERRSVLAGFPRWGLSVAEGALVNETVLMLEAVSRSKGCYLGQETVAKVESRRGAAYGPALLLVDGAVNLPAVDLVGEAFEIAGRRGGTVLGLAEHEGRMVLEAALYRDFRVQEQRLTLHLPSAEAIPVTVAYPPLLLAPSARESADELYHRAVRDFAAGREEEAVRRLELAVAEWPGHADAHESLGVILGRRGEYEAAIARMEQLLEVDPESVMAHTNLSLFYNRLGRIEEAEREQAEAAGAATRRQQSERDRAEAERRRAEEANVERTRRRAMFEQVLELDPDDVLAAFGLGELLVEEERYADAVVRLRRVLEVSPEHSAAYLALGKAYEGAGDGELARTTYLRGVEIAAHRGDLMTANAMQERLARLGA